ncbi:MAG: hypothetical protein PsegKO_18740 [Pseudohongiellaceae bacterium]
MTDKTTDRKHAEITGYDPIPLGRYRHYKGPYYELIDIARHSETEEPMAVYRTLYGDFDLWVRPLTMFLEEIERDGQTLPRFSFTPES